MDPELLQFREDHQRRCGGSQQQDQTHQAKGLWLSKQWKLSSADSRRMRRLKDAQKVAFKNDPLFLRAQQPEILLGPAFPGDSPSFSRHTKKRRARNSGGRGGG